MDNSKDKQCQVCQQAASVLYILPCYHTLCQGCLQTHGEGDKNITCRVCGAKYGISGDSQTSSVEDIPAEFSLLLITEGTCRTDTNTWCCSCGAHCKDCRHASTQSFYASALDGMPGDVLSSDGREQESSFCRPESREDGIEVFSMPGSSFDFSSRLDSVSVDDPSAASDFFSSVNLEKCGEHGYHSTNYCLTHSTVCCAECTRLQHKHCDMKDIHEAAMETPSESDLHRLQRSFSSLMDIQMALIYEMERNSIEIGEWKEKIMATFKELKNDVNRRLTELEDKIKTNLQEVENERGSLQNNIDDFKTKREILRNASNKLEGYPAKTAEKLQNYCLVKAKVQEQKDFLHTQRHHMSKVSVNITKKKGFDDFLQQIPGLLELSCERVKLETMKKLKCQEKLMVKRWTHTKLPHITGMCYLGNVLIICDNVKQRFFTYDSQRVWNCYKIGRSPWDVAVIENQEIAVSTPEGIQIVNLQYYPHKELGFPRFLPTDFPCFGVDYFAGDIYIASNTHIRILSVGDNRLQSFKCPGLSVQYICVCSPDRLYLTDTNSNRLFCMNSKGETLKVFPSEMLESPMGVAIGPGTNIVVVNASSKTVLRFTKDGHLVEIRETEDNHNNGFGPEVVCCYGDACAIAAGQHVYKCHFI